MTGERRSADERGRVIHAIVARLETDADGITEEIAASILDQVPGYAQFADSSAASKRFHEDVRAMVVSLIGTLHDDRSPSEEELASVTDLAERRAWEGLAFNEMHRAIQVGECVGRRHLFRAWGELPESDRDLALYAHMRDRLVDGVFEWGGAIQAGFARADGDRRDDRAGAREEFLRGLLKGNFLDPVAAQAQGAAFDLELSTPVGVVVLVERVHGDREATTSSDWTSRVRDCVRTLGAPRPALLFVEPDPSDPGFAVLLVADATGPRLIDLCERLDRACRDRGLVAVYEVADALTGLPVVFIRLRAPVSVLARLPERLGSITTPEAIIDFRAAGALKPAEQEAELRYTLGRVMANERTGAVHFKTLRVLERAGWHVVAAARLLTISESGLRDRMARIEQLSSLNLERDRFHFTLALRIAELWGDRLPSVGDSWWNDPAA